MFDSVSPFQILRALFAELTELPRFDLHLIPLSRLPESVG
jgi:hypothetical protein